MALYAGNYPEDYPDGCPPEGQNPNLLVRLVNDPNNLTHDEFQHYIHDPTVKCEVDAAKCSSHSVSLWDSITEAKEFVESQSAKRRRKKSWHGFAAGVLPPEAGNSTEGPGHVDWYPGDTETDRRQYFSPLETDSE